MLRLLVLSLRFAIALCAAAVVVLGALPRILLAAGALPDPLRPFTWSDPLFTYVRSLSALRLPHLDTPFEYPPIVAGISGLFSLLVDHAAVYVALSSALLAIAAGATAWILVPAAGSRRVLWRFALLATGDVLVFATISPLTFVRWAPGGTRTAALLGALVALRHWAVVLTRRDLRAIG